LECAAFGSIEFQTAALDDSNRHRHLTRRYDNCRDYHVNTLKAGIHAIEVPCAKLPRQDSELNHSGREGNLAVRMRVTGSEDPTICSQFEK
jgi:hypothetical protein